MGQCFFPLEHMKHMNPVFGPDHLSARALTSFSLLGKEKKVFVVQGFELTDVFVIYLDHIVEIWFQFNIKD